MNQPTTKQIDAEIRRVVGELAAYHSWRVSQHLQLGQEIILTDEMAAPFALTLRELFDHAYGDRQVEWIADTCQSVCEALFVPPATFGGGYEIPEAFWETLTGQAIQLAMGARPDIPDDAIIESRDACQIANITRAALQDWRESGRLTPFDQKGGTGGFRYRAGDVRAARRRHDNDDDL